MMVVLRIPWIQANPMKQKFRSEVMELLRSVKDGYRISYIHKQLDPLYGNRFVDKELAAMIEEEYLVMTEERNIKSVLE
jgi:hypothetical protein